MMISMIAAVSANNVIGKDGKLPFNYPEDLKHFSKTTRNHFIVMGRKTWESLPKVLPNRKSIVISSQSLTVPEGVVVETSIIRAINHCKDQNLLRAQACLELMDIWLIGGTSIYQEGMKHADMILLTRTPDVIEGDVLAYFPEIESKFKLNNTEPFPDPSKLILEKYSK